VKPNCRIKITEREIIPDSNTPEHVLFDNLEAEMQSKDFQGNNPVYKITIFRQLTELPKIWDVVEVLDFPNFPELKTRWTLNSSPSVNTSSGVVEFTVVKLRQLSSF
jgi:hypothetical protein